MASTLFLEHIVVNVFDKFFILIPKAGEDVDIFLFTRSLSFVTDYYYDLMLNEGFLRSSSSCF